ncbi:AMIN-like domain-containing (lipo)protein [Stigmatella aurantiaca]|uniref:Conserved uncharacterized protein n=1 Tax=Stigmatella aurantiaca (strain DW4/3-1) TaxID=378806 RepID=Q099E7_STIAD|nr:hypothetical protein [Stigmatella aurantiaca]ADO75596.1 conserved uncharacterized protein [Stigmatella aurantiaca DW4/3-1]EAU68346.1 conserved hypothetical protein [Stigmatella aurantiaca DW4/3-1]
MTQWKAVGRGMSALWLMGVLVAAGCTKKEESPPPPPPPPVAAPTPAPPPPPAEPAAPPAAPAAAAPAPTEAPPEPQGREWGTDRLAVQYTPSATVTLRSVRTGRNEGFDRVVFEFDGPELPGYRVEFVEKPVIKCGSGDPTELQGQGALQVSLSPAQAHEGGQVTVAERERKLALPSLQALKLICDFEAEVIWVLGTPQARQPYRVLELREPTRLVVDVRH